MLELTLPETKRKTNKKRLFGVGAVSVTVHTVVIAGAVFATLHAGRTDNSVKVDTTVVLLEPQAQQKAPEPPQLSEPLQGFQTVVVPAQIPTAIPPVNLQEHFDPKDFTGVGVEGGRADGRVPDPNEVYAEALVDQKPAMLTGRPPSYPELLRQAGIQGRVIIQAIVDTTGRVEAKSIRIVKSPNPGFDQPTIQSVLNSLFRPARLQGHAVRVLISLPFDYSLSSAGSSGR